MNIRGGHLGDLLHTSCHGSMRNIDIRTNQMSKTGSDGTFVRTSRCSPKDTYQDLRELIRLDEDEEKRTSLYQMDYENVVLVKNDVYVYRIPPRQSNRGHRAADWTLDAPHWTGRLRAVAKGKELVLKLEDRNTGELFAKCPIDSFPGIAVESVTDSSRYFVIRLMADDGRTMFTGIGFSERSDSFDFNVAIQDHFKWVAVEEKEANQPDIQPSLNLSFKEGQKIKLNLNTRRTGDEPTSGSNAVSKPRPSARVGGPLPSATGLLPPPPAPSRSRGYRGGGGSTTTTNLISPTEETLPAVTAPTTMVNNSQPPTGMSSNVDLLADIFGT